MNITEKFKLPDLPTKGDIYGFMKLEVGEGFHCEAKNEQTVSSNCHYNSKKRKGVLGRVFKYKHVEGDKYLVWREK